MINITRPVMETHKTVAKSAEKTLDRRLKDTKEKQRLIEEVKPQEETSPILREDIERAVRDTNRVLFQDNDHFEFKIHERTGRIMVKLVDNQTDEVIKEIPPEKILDLVASIWDLVGILVDERG